jgi:hypothetical protein
MLPSTTAATALLVALITAAAAIAKKYIGGKRPDHVTRPEFHQSIDALRDRIDVNHREVLSAVDRLAATTEHRLDRLDRSVARLDERTRTDIAPSIH